MRVSENFPSSFAKVEDASAEVFDDAIARQAISPSAIMFVDGAVFLKVGGDSLRLVVPTLYVACFVDDGHKV